MFFCGQALYTAFSYFYCVIALHTFGGALLGIQEKQPTPQQGPTRRTKNTEHIKTPPVPLVNA